jgi:apolipoprotein N-acyltransferase
MRSKEFQRPTIRATNSGGTVIISAKGEVLAELKPYVRGNLTGHIPESSQEITVFAYWAGKWGLMPMWMMTGAIMCMALMFKLFGRRVESLK